MYEPHVPSEAAKKLAASIYKTVLAFITEDNEASEDEVIMAIAQILQELRSDGRQLIVRSTFSHSN